MELTPMWPYMWNRRRRMMIEQDVKRFLAEWNDEKDSVLVHTSGSTGQPKALWVEKQRMLSSARITCDFLGLKEGDTALLCLSPDYIAGKMMVVRALERGLQLICVEPDGHPLKHITEHGEITFAAMVSMQVYNSLQVPEERERLMGIKHLIIGGGAIDDDLAQELKDFPHAVWSTYGMTETLSHIALRRLSGNDVSDHYVPFDGVEVSVNADHCLVIHAPQVCAHSLVTNDLAELAPDGRRFRIIGRKDNVICSGGIKIQIEEMERLLKPYIPVPFMVTKVLDEKFGEAVVLLSCNSSAPLKEICQSVLPPFWCPRHFLTVGVLPTTETGKPARRKAEELAMNMLR